MKHQAEVVVDAAHPFGALRSTLNALAEQVGVPDGAEVLLSFEPNGLKVVCRW